MKGWAVAQTQSNAASVAVTNLRRQGFEYYNPLYSERTRQGFRRVQLFQNYLFVKIEREWRALLSTKGILRLVLAAGGLPGVISPKFIGELRSQENDHGLVVLPKFKFRRGDKVSIKSSVWSGLPGVYDGQSASDRAIVLVSLLGSMRPIELDEGDLAAA